MPHPSRVLVVDDDRSHRAIFEKGLAAEGYEVVSAPGAQEALDLLAPTLETVPTGPPARDRIDLVLLDILMPGVDGTEVLDHIRRAKASHELPVIMATAKDDPDDIVHALQAGANDYVTKPVNVPVVLARVQTQLALRKAHRSLRDAHQSLIHAARMESVGYLAAGVANDIQGPCSEVREGLEILGRSPAITGDEELSRTLAAMTGAVDRSERVIRGLTDFSAEDRLDLQPRDARQVVEEATELLQTELADADVYVETEFDPALPAALFAREELRQALVIVLLNAIEAMPDLGSIKVRTCVQVSGESTLPVESVSSSAIARGDQVVCIEVLDTGTGLQTDDPLTPFTAFYSTKDKSSSVGLGLTIARKLMDLHGGLIRIANRDDGEEGACVTLSLRPA